MEVNPVGRPKVMTPETISKLEEAFLVGATDKEACFVANISPATLYEYCKENPEYSERKEALKDMPKFLAKKNVTEAINDGDKSLSQWYLERKVKDEFAQRSEHTGKDGKDLSTGLSEEEKAKLDLLLAHPVQEAGLALPAKG